MLRKISAKNTQNNLYELIEKVSKKNKPIQITHEKGDVVLISEKEWQAICDTLKLMGNDLKQSDVYDSTDYRNESDSEYHVHSNKIDLDQL